MDIGTEIEFRNYSDLSEDGIVYRGRIEKKNKYAIFVKVEYETSFHITSYNIPVGHLWPKKHKTIYKRAAGLSGRKLPWKKIEPIYHILTCNHWKRKANYKSIGEVKFNNHNPMRDYYRCLFEEKL